MTILDLFFPIATVVLAAGCYVCYKTNKPLREKAAEEREALAKKKAKEEADGRERDRLSNQTKEVFDLLEDALRDPYRYFTDNRYGSSLRGRCKYETLNSLASFLSENKRLKAIGVEQATRLDTQSKLIRELQKQQKEILKALQLGVPVDCINDF